MRSATVSSRAIVACLVAVLVYACSDATPPVAVPSAPAATQLLSAVSFYGPERFTRGKGAPQTETRTISTIGFQAPFVLHIRNGNANGTNRVSSGSVGLDGVTLLDPSAFNPNASGWDLSVDLGASATLEVSLASKPGSFLDIWIEGEPAYTLFCPAGGPGAYLDLQLAINATNPDGTIKVCDGEWPIPQAHVNRPLTIRSLNPGSATLRDTLSVVGSQNSPPAVWVDSVPSGLVRFVDIGFNSHGRALVLGNEAYVGNTFDQVQIDSVWFIGRNTTNAFGVETFYSATPGAVTEFTNSRCSHVNICVFAVGATPTNVRRSRFDSSAVLYSTNNGGGAHYGLGTAEDNEFVQCSRPTGSCIQVFTREGAVTIARNKITQLAPMPLAPNAAIAITRSSIVTGFPNAQVIIEDNEILSAPTGGVPSTQAGWRLLAGIGVTEVPSAGVTHLIRRNRIVDAFNGFIFATGQAVTVNDNTVSGGFRVFQQGASAFAVNYQRNDATGTLTAFSAPPLAATSNYRCNWWGSVAGPTPPPPSIPVARYTPFSTVPIANQPGVICP